MSNDRHICLFRYDQGREDGAVIDDWEDPKFEIYHTQDRYLVFPVVKPIKSIIHMISAPFYTPHFIQNDLGVSFLVTLRDTQNIHMTVVFLASWPFTMCFVKEYNASVQDFQTNFMYS